MLKMMCYACPLTQCQAPPTKHTHNFLSLDETLHGRDGLSTFLYCWVVNWASKLKVLYGKRLLNVLHEYNIIVGYAETKIIILIFEQGL